MAMNSASDELFSGARKDNARQLNGNGNEVLWYANVVHLDS